MIDPAQQHLMRGNYHGGVLHPFPCLSAPSLKVMYCCAGLTAYSPWYEARMIDRDDSNRRMLQVSTFLAGATTKIEFEFDVGFVIGVCYFSRGHKWTRKRPAFLLCAL